MGSYLHSKHSGRDFGPEHTSEAIPGEGKPGKPLSQTSAPEVGDPLGVRSWRPATSRWVGSRQESVGATRYGGDFLGGAAAAAAAEVLRLRPGSNSGVPLANSGN